jgi:16S rRNA (cytosine967-C5)-methyltransferase
LSITNPRHAAFTILARIEKERSYSDILIDRELSAGAIQGPDRGLLTELVYGVLRRQGTLDYVIGQFSRIAVSRLERAVLGLLRIGLYQLLFLDRIPSSAAVNETVKLAHVLAPRSAGFINAVLRQADRQRDSIKYPDRDRSPHEYLAARYSHPVWIVKEWERQLGFEGAEALAAVMSDIPPLTIRCNTLRISRKDLAERLLAEGATATDCEYSPLGMHLSASTPASTLASFREGLFSIQDEASQIAALLVGAVPGERIVDLCAAPGGKATCLAELMENRGEVVACDIHPRRLEQVTAFAARLGIGMIRTMALDASQPDAMPKGELFDRVLLDAPCSGLGVLRRNPESKWWKRPEDIRVLAEKQRSILANAATLVRPGGVLLYSTCSTSIAEDEDVLDDFLSRNSGFVLEDLRKHFLQHAPLFTEQGMFRSWPHLHGMDGFFAARLKRVEN